jgi:hypothetical protein
MVETEMGMMIVDGWIILMAEEPPARATDAVTSWSDLREIQGTVDAWALLADLRQNAGGAADATEVPLAIPGRREGPAVGDALRPSLRGADYTPPDTESEGAGSSVGLDVIGEDMCCEDWKSEAEAGSEPRDDPDEVIIPDWTCVVRRQGRECRCRNAYDRPTCRSCGASREGRPLGTEVDSGGEFVTVTRPPDGSGPAPGPTESVRRLRTETVKLRPEDQEEVKRLEK